ncbi:formylglycine-generating enzyme required for sulfatase activity [Catenuloplanes nepalensis]|uniref:Formylglycine-generating enzyme required for sulfatase activity n=1 Tax=Catenuloplanes nepalensis TaxID=587533 RepID=A0ABT9MLW0_9ACTN|nr:SUMF1/EgtB/PvdO family nonheme iron enzyme [Catenuloplanes nepalensis]MDP9792413.1 formylglycine-generating enzyme required for sulfatase activity [Catenuloplanes nepalensis]
MTGSARVSFGIWSDRMVAAEQLQSDLSESGVHTITVGGDTGPPIECLVVLTQKPQLDPGELATLTRLANRAKITIAVDRHRPGVDDAPPWPRDATLHWGGHYPDLSQVAEALVDLVRPPGLLSTALPAFLPTSTPLPGIPLAVGMHDLIEQLQRPEAPRLVSLTRSLYAELLHAPRARSRNEYDLFRLVHWAAQEKNRPFINTRLARSEKPSIRPERPRSLDEVLDDLRTRRLVMLLGEPSSGKSQQLRYFDARSALRSIQQQEGGPRAPGSFYVALSSQPSQPDISMEWLARQWSMVADTARWHDLPAFLADGGTVLLDGLNEGGIRSLPLREWMNRWRDVITQLFEAGALKVVVSCRTRDQLIQMREPATEVSLRPLSTEDIVAIATQADPRIARRLKHALAEDGRIADLYASPFRLRKFLESGADDIVGTEARLFGLVIVAAILRDLDQDNPHGDLISDSAAARLRASSVTDDGNPWLELETIPMIKAFAALARKLTFPTTPGGSARLTMQPVRAIEVLEHALAEARYDPAKAPMALDAAKDFDILQEQRGEVRFIHPSLQHLFAASGCTDEEIVALAEQERQSSPHRPVTPHRWSPGRLPPYADHRYGELFKFAAQLRPDVPRLLLRVDPVLAARTYLAAGLDAEDGVDDEIRATLANSLVDEVSRPRRAAITAALGELGWRLPTPGFRGSEALATVPASEWRLGHRDRTSTPEMDTDSETRTVRLGGFRLSRFPVSNLEYRAFVESGGYDDKAWWTPEGWQWVTNSRAVEQSVVEWRRRQTILNRDLSQIVRLLREERATPASAAALLRFARLSESEIVEYVRSRQDRPIRSPGSWDTPALSNPLQPVVGVSWFEANAFCAWLTDQYGKTFRLPSENEWEAACLHSLGLTDCAAVAGTIGTDFGNTMESGFQATTPIRTYATTAQEAHRLPVEMLGNVFEWNFDYYAPGHHNRRILKGGSWRHEAWRAHPAYRGRGVVDAQYNDVGFRYVMEEARS